MEKIMHTLYFIIILFSFCFASFEKTGTGASAIGLSLSGAASTKGYFAVFSNSALLNPANRIEVFYRNYFGIKSFDQIALSVCFPVYSHPFALAIQRSGNQLYSETEMIVACNYAFAKDVKLAIGLPFYILEIKNYGNASSLGINLSFLFQISDQLRMAATYNNVNEPVIGKARQSIPVSGVLAFSYSPVNEAEILIDLYKEDVYDFEYRIGTRILIFKTLYMLAGFQQNINSFSFGIEYLNDICGIFYSVDVHPVLNISHALGLSYDF